MKMIFVFTWKTTFWYFLSVLTIVPLPNLEVIFYSNAQCNFVLEIFMGFQSFDYTCDGRLPTLCTVGFFLFYSAHVHFQSPLLGLGNRTVVGSRWNVLYLCIVPVLMHYVAWSHPSYLDTRERDEFMFSSVRLERSIGQLPLTFQQKVSGA